MGRGPSGRPRGRCLPRSRPPPRAAPPRTRAQRDGVPGRPSPRLRPSGDAAHEIRKGRHRPCGDEQGRPALPGACGQTAASPGASAAGGRAMTTSQPSSSAATTAAKRRPGWGTRTRRSRATPSSAAATRPSDGRPTAATRRAAAARTGEQGESEGGPAGHARALQDDRAPPAEPGRAEQLRERRCHGQQLVAGEDERPGAPVDRGELRPAGASLPDLAYRSFWLRVDETRRVHGGITIANIRSLFQLGRRSR